MIPYSERTRVIVVIGTRSDAIKMIPVIRALQDSGTFRPVVISTGEQPKTVDRLIRQAGMLTDANLRSAEPIRDRRPSRSERFARVMVGIDRVWASEHVPEEYRTDGRRGVGGAVACLVHGDTTSAAAAAVTAFNLGIPVVHVEAGLRFPDQLGAFPEEGNRQIIARIAAMHVAPTSLNKQNLVREGIAPDDVVVTGNPGIDMLRWAAEQSGGFGPGLEELERDPRPRIVLVTAHRRESWEGGIAGVAEAVRRLAERYPETQFVVPMDRNPVARGPFLAALWNRENAHLVEPRDYTDFARLMRAAHLVITDSGGVQEEAPSLGTPVLVARDTTDHSEGVSAGTLTLVGTDPQRIVSEAARLFDDAEEHARRAAHANPYGDGFAAARIVEALDRLLNGAPAGDADTGAEADQ